MNKQGLALFTATIYIFSINNSFAQLDTSAYVADKLSNSTQSVINFENSYTYQGNTFVQMSSSEQNIGAYYCSDAEVVFLPVENRQNGNIYVNDAYQNLYLYRKNGNAGILSDAIRLRYQGKLDSSSLLGRQDCTQMLTSIVQYIGSNGLAEIAYSSADGNGSLLHYFSEIKTTFEYLFSNIVVYPKGADYVEKLADWAFNIPFGAGQVELITTSSELLQTKVVPIAREAGQVKIYTSTDSPEMKELLKKSKSNQFIQLSDTQLKSQRFATLVSQLIEQGVDSDIISATNRLPSVDAMDDNVYSSDAIILVSPKVSSQDVGVAIIKSAIGQSISTNNTIPTVVKSVKETISKNEFYAGNGQLLSTSLNNFLIANGYKMIWEIDSGVDWRFDIEQKINENGVFVETLEKVLNNFPVQAVMSRNGNTVRIKMRHADNGNIANNVIPLIN